MVASSDFDPAAARRHFETVRSRSLGLRRRADALQVQAAFLRHSSADAIQEAQRVISVARTLRGSSTPTPGVELQPPSVLIQALAACRMDADDLQDLAEGLIAAHQDAADLGDEEVQALLRAALMQVGRHLAEQLGPRSAGVRLH